MKLKSIHPFPGGGIGQETGLTAGPDQLRDQAARLHPAFAERRQFQRPLPLRQLPPLRTDRQRNMTEFRLLQSQRPVKEQLARSAGNQIRPPYHLGHPHERIVDHDGQLVRGAAEIAGHQKVPSDPPGLELHRPANQVVPSDEALGNPKPPGEGPVAKPLCISSAAVGASSRIERFFVFRMRRAGGPLDLRPGASARIDLLARLEPLERSLIMLMAEGLKIRSRGSAEIGTLVPIQPKPPQVDHRFGDGTLPHAACIQILEPQNHAAPLPPGHQPSDQERSSMAKVKPSRRRRREPPPNRSTRSRRQT